MTEPEEPHCPEGRVPHGDRIVQIVDTLLAGMTAAVCIDDTEEHRAWYIHQLAKHPELEIVGQGSAMGGVYIIRVKKL